MLCPVAQGNLNTIVGSKLRHVLQIAEAYDSIVHIQESADRNKHVGAGSIHQMYIHHITGSLRTVGLQVVT